MDHELKYKIYLREEKEKKEKNFRIKDKEFLD